VKNVPGSDKLDPVFDSKEPFLLGLRLLFLLLKGCLPTAPALLLLFPILLLGVVGSRLLGLATLVLVFTHF
jgi:hypothetical protein